MATQEPTDAEVFQRFLADQVVSTGRNMSPEELVSLWRERQKEQAETLDALSEGVEDMNAGRVFPFADVNNDVRRNHGWSATE